MPPSTTTTTTTAPPPAPNPVAQSPSAPPLMPPSTTAPFNNGNNNNNNNSSTAPSLDTRRRSISFNYPPATAPTLPTIHDARSAWSPADTPLPPIDQLAGAGSQHPAPMRRHSQVPVGSSSSSVRPRLWGSPGSSTTIPGNNSLNRIAAPAGSRAHRASIGSSTPPATMSGPSAIHPSPPNLPPPRSNFTMPLPPWGDRPLRPHRWSDDLPQARRSFVRANLLATVTEASTAATPAWSGVSTSHTHAPRLPSPRKLSSPTTPLAPLPPGRTYPFPIPGMDPSVLREAPPSAPPSSAFAGEVSWDMPYVPQRGKRKRSQRSCTACHKAKRRCDRKQPCSNCTFNGKVCQYYDDAGILTLASKTRRMDSLPSSALSYPLLPPVVGDDPEEDQPYMGSSRGSGGRSISMSRLPDPFTHHHHFRGSTQHDESSQGMAYRATRHQSLSEVPVQDGSSSALTVLTEAADPTTRGPEPTTTQTTSLPVLTPPPAPDDRHASLSAVPGLVRGLSNSSGSSASVPGDPDHSRSGTTEWSSALPPSPGDAVAYPQHLHHRGRMESKTLDFGDSQTQLGLAAKALLPSTQVQGVLLHRVRSRAFPLSLCIPDLPLSSTAGYRYEADHALLHALYAVGSAYLTAQPQLIRSPPSTRNSNHAGQQEAKAHMRAARLLLVFRRPVRECGSDNKSLVFALLGLGSLLLGQAHQACLDTMCAWRLIELEGSTSNKMLCHAVAVLDALASLYAGVRTCVSSNVLEHNTPNSSVFPTESDEVGEQEQHLARTLACLAHLLTLQSHAQVDSWLSTLPPTLSYSQEGITSLITAAERATGSNVTPSPTSTPYSTPLGPKDSSAVGWACIHALAASFALDRSSPNNGGGSMALARGQIASIKAGLDVCPAWAQAAALFTLVPYTRALNPAPTEWWLVRDARHMGRVTLPNSIPSAPQAPQKEE